MKKRQWIRLLALLLSLCLVLALLTVSFADFGGFSGDGDYGGGDDGGSGGDDYGGGFFFFGGGDDSGSGGGNSFWGVLVIVAICLIYLLCKRLFGKNAEGSRTPQVVQTKALPPLLPMADYSRIDPGFREAELVQRLSNLYVQLQQCWTAKDLTPLRPYFADAYFAQMENQLASYRTRGVTNYIDRIAVLNVVLNGYCQADGVDHIFATLNTRIVDYTCDDRTGAVVAGSRTTEKFMTYRWHLVRPTGQTSTVLGGLTSFNCPHCGAPLNINQSAKCPYCDSVITVEKHGFVLTEIQGLAQRSS